jgi:hypothetical protein
LGREPDQQLDGLRGDHNCGERALGYADRQYRIFEEISLDPYP